MEKMRMESLNLTQRNIIMIKSLFPNCVSEGKDEKGNLTYIVNFPMLKQMLSPTVIDGDEAFEFTWVGKKAATVEANKPIRKTLRPCVEQSVNWDTTQNIFIEGDNLEALKLLQESYLGAVKMIYIDPPYNTGHDFIYPDTFIIDSDKYDESSGYVDEDGTINFTRENSTAAARYHSDWCSMMYSRLMLARNLLTEDGVIFISIDDNEVFNLKTICDEVFGSSNFIAQLAVQLNPRGRNLDVFVAKTYESVLVYAMNYNQMSTIIGVEKEGRMVEEYNKEDEKGKYRAIGLRNRNQAFNPQTRPNLYFPLYVNPSTKKVSTKKSDEFVDEVWPDAPDGTKTCWTWMRQKVEAENDLIIAEKSGDEWRIYRKDYLIKDGEVSTTLVKSLWTENTINNDYGKKAIKDLFGTNVMSFPKAPDLIKRMIQIGTRKDSIVMDFFSGSATTAHAVFMQNMEDGGHRRFIMVQVAEPCEAGSEAEKAGLKTIADIGRERIRLAGKKMQEEAPLGTQDYDFGFRAFKIDETNMKDVYYSADEITQHNLLGMLSNIKEDRTPLDLLFGCLLEWGLPLSLPYTSEQIEGCTVHTYNDGDLIACFDENVPDSVIKTIARRQPLRAVFRDSSFADSPAKINVGEIFKLLAPDTRVKVI
ncbi:MAG: site-specific DNA-methyltransferase [Clostridia bacterium]|nr:site-specific DNA-methyltransferase [Clostridia bacterium]MBR1586626.1 site-specific DNA-methyltransferase [Clostridia bacterium]